MHMVIQQVGSRYARVKGNWHTKTAKKTWWNKKIEDTETSL